MICKRCGRDEDQHHAFEPEMSRPEGCMCDPNSWRDLQVEPVCSEFKPNPPNAWTCCERCYHDKECHKC